MQEKLPHVFNADWVNGKWLYKQQKFGQIMMIQELCVFSFKVLVNFLYAAPLRRHSATICDVTTIQLANGTVQKLNK